MAYSNRAASYLNLGNYNLGCRDAQKACELGECELLEEAKGNKRCLSPVLPADNGVQRTAAEW